MIAFTYKAFREYLIDVQIVLVGILFVATVILLYQLPAGASLAYKTTNIIVALLVLSITALAAFPYLNRSWKQKNSHQKNQYRLQEALRIAKLGNWELKPSGELYWSKEVYEMFGISPSHFSNELENFYKLTHPDDRGIAQQAVEEGWQTGIVDVTYRVILEDQSLKILRGRGEVVFDSEKRPITMLGSVQDITETVELEEKLRQSQKMEAVGQLTGGIVHDFNNLMGVIQGNTELLLADSHDWDQQQLNQIITAVDKGKRLTDRLLALSRQKQLHPQLVQINKLIDGMSDILVRTLGESIQVRLDIPKSLPFVYVDSSQLENALLNLTLNSRDAMPDGGILNIKCKATRVTDSNRFGHEYGEVQTKQGDYVLLSVEDNGVGMDSEMKAKAFNPFFTTKQGKGTGLGLSMVYGTIQQSGGFIGLKSELGAGTRVDLYLPVKTDNTLHFDTANSEESKEVEWDHVPVGKSILILEDNEAFLYTLVNQLGRIGYTVFSAETADAGLDILQNHSVDLVLSDIVLPGGMNGVEFYHQAKQAFSDLNIIFMSGYTDNILNEQDINFAEHVLLKKPFKYADLTHAIHDRLCCRCNSSLSH